MVEALRAEVVELRARLGQNPSNSSKPPSSEGWAKPAPKSLRRRSGRKPGGQDGHPGSTVAQVADPDEVVCHEPAGCAGCGGGLGDASEVGVERRQVFDLPPIRVQVTEHQMVSRRCDCCGTTTKAVAPGGVDAPACYGPRVAGIVLYLYVGQFLSKKRAAGALAELFGTPVGEGTVAAMSRGHDWPRRGSSGRVRRAGAGPDRRRRRRAFRRDRATGGRSAALGALGVHRQILPDHRA